MHISEAEKIRMNEAVEKIGALTRQIMAEAEIALGSALPTAVTMAGASGAPEAAAQEMVIASATLQFVMQAMERAATDTSAKANMSFAVAQATAAMVLRLGIDICDYYEMAHELAHTLENGQPETVDVGETNLANTLPKGTA